MGSFIVVDKRHRGGDGRLPQVAADAMANQGFTTPTIIDAPEYTLALYPQQVSGDLQYHRADNGDFCVATGCLLFRGRRGTDALKQLLWEFDPAVPGALPLRGNFALVVRKQGRSLLLGDALGLYKIFGGEGVWSSSFLAAASLVTQPVVARQAVCEYVLQGASYGGETLLTNIRLLEPDECVDLESSRSVSSARPAIAALAHGRPSADAEEAVRETLKDWFGEIVSAFGDEIDTGLSGGYDSRLVLALLRANRCQPRLHVYGQAGDADVRIAKAICEGEGIELAHVDKAQGRFPADDEYGELCRRNLWRFDGYPVDGVFDNGNDWATRIQRVRRGALALNGGGGEIFRNFFYLRDRAFSAGELQQAFYARYDPRMFPTATARSSYRSRLAAKIAACVGADDGQLSRTAVELLFPAFRCRYWMGKNNSINNRLGPALTPFIDYEVVRRALCLPLHRKNHGRAEAAMIQAIDPRLAAYTSSYGHRFDEPPSAAHRRTDHLAMLRPPWLRQYAFRVKTRLIPPQRSDALSPHRLALAFDSSFPRLRNWLRTEHVVDNQQLNRLCTAELLLQTVLGHAKLED